MNKQKPYSKIVNYLHYGDGLNELIELVDLSEGYFRKADLVNYLLTKRNISKFSLDIIKGFNGSSIKQVDIGILKTCLCNSVEQQLFFNKNNCRGFSYYVSDNFDFSHKLNTSINFKLALLSDKSLYYPLRVRRYLPMKQKNHIKFNGYPSIAFTLGKIRNNNLFVFILQSDLISKGPSYIREYFKGWRKVLFSEIINYTKNKNITSIFLCSSKDIVRTCHHDLTDESPGKWFYCYDKTAEQFNMKIIELEDMVNIQVLNNFPKVLTKNMYHLNLQL